MVTCPAVDQGKRDFGGLGIRVSAFTDTGGYGYLVLVIVGGRGVDHLVVRRVALLVEGSDLPAVTTLADAIYPTITPAASGAVSRPSSTKGRFGR